jgi:radical SAM protein with 4Fe4S-binding SPASM domain
MGMKVAVATNGQRFMPDTAWRTLKHISWIRFSLDTIDTDLYKQIHGVSAEALNMVLRNIAYAVSVKRTENLSVDIGVQVVLTEETALTLNDTVAYLKAIGVDNVQIKPCHTHPSSSHQTGMDTSMYDHVRIEMQDYEEADFKVLVRTKSMNRLEMDRTYSRCHGFDFYVLINARGEVVPCNVFYDKPEFVYGNINEQGIGTIWRSDRRKHIIESVENSCFSHCGTYRCRLDVMNRYLHRIKNPERNDVFI